MKKEVIKEVIIECPRLNLKRCLWPALTVFFVATTGVFIGLFVWKATAEVEEKGGLDLSGPAFCSDNNITFDQNHMHLWTTYPLKPHANTTSAILQSFRGKNLFAHNMNKSTQFFTAKVTEIVDNTTLLYESTGEIFTNDCYVTIDSINPNPFCIGCSTYKKNTAGYLTCQMFGCYK